jgi:hypothetical protein
MRAMILSTCALIAMTAQTQAMDWETFSFNQDSTSPQESTSFSIGYPKGWESFQDHSQDRKDGLNVVSLRTTSFICCFGDSATTATNVENTQRHTSYFIWPSHGATAAEAASTFFNDEGNVPAYQHETMTEIKTSADDSGWLVESAGYLMRYPAVAKLMNNAFLERTNPANELLRLEKDNNTGEKIPVIDHDYFFHSERQGAIHIQIMTDAANAALRLELDHLVLETLRFKRGLTKS